MTERSLNCAAIARLVPALMVMPAVVPTPYVVMMSRAVIVRRILVCVMCVVVRGVDEQRRIDIRVDTRVR